MAESQTAGKTLFPGKGQVTSESTSAVYEERKRQTERNQIRGKRNTLGKQEKNRQESWGLATMAVFYQLVLHLCGCMNHGPNLFVLS